MTTAQLDPQKIEKLLKAATSQRQRKMYQTLLDKARKQEKDTTAKESPKTTPSTAKKAQKKTKTVKKNQKVATQSTTKEVSTATKQSSKTATESSSLSSASTEPAPSNIESTPQTEPKSQSQEKQTAATAPLFQALGTVIATPSLQDEQIKIEINDSKYSLLSAQGFYHKTHIKLKKELEQNGSEPMFLRVYPKIRFDNKTQKPRIAFSLVAFNHDCEKINDEPPGFLLRGIWQYIPQSKTPVITIYRNRETIDVFEKLNKQQQFFFARPNHIPVVWDATVEPFKFNPKVEKGAQMPRYFVEVRAVLKGSLFIVKEMLSEPTLKIPQYIKVQSSFK